MTNKKLFRLKWVPEKEKGVKQMIDQKFCTEAFEKHGPDSEVARELADLLAEEIQAELHQAIQPAPIAGNPEVEPVGASSDAVRATNTR